MFAITKSKPVLIITIILFVNSCSIKSLVEYEGNHLIEKSSRALHPVRKGHSVRTKTRIYNSDKDLIAIRYIWLRKGCVVATPVKKQIIYFNDERKAVKKYTILIGGENVQFIKEDLLNCCWEVKKKEITDDKELVEIAKLFYQKYL